MVYMYLGTQLNIASRQSEYGAAFREKNKTNTQVVSSLLLSLSLLLL